MLTHLVCSALEADLVSIIQLSTTVSSNDSGTGPLSRTTWWNSFISNFAPEYKKAIFIFGWCFPFTCNILRNGPLFFEFALWRPLTQNAWVRFVFLLGEHNCISLVGYNTTIPGETEQLTQHWQYIPSSFSAFARNSCIFNSPILYAHACPGNVMYLLTSYSAIATEVEVWVRINSLASSFVQLHHEKNV